MDQFINLLETVLGYIAKTGIFIAELIGIVVILITIIKTAVGYFKKDPALRLTLAYGIMLALEFKVGSEVLRTVEVRNWTELSILGATILLRAVLAVLLHWEIQNEEKHMKLSANSGVDTK